MSGNGTVGSTFKEDSVLPYSKETAMGSGLTQFNMVSKAGGKRMSKRMSKKSRKMNKSHKKIGGKNKSCKKCGKVFSFF